MQKPTCWIWRLKTTSCFDDLGKPSTPGLAGQSAIKPGFLCQNLESFAVDAHDAPLAEHVGTDALVEVDGELVPVEHVPLEAVAALEGNSCKPREDSLRN